jgi:hypothetical protein
VQSALYWEHRSEDGVGVGDGEGEGEGVPVTVGVPVPVDDWLAEKHARPPL